MNVKKTFIEKQSGYWDTYNSDIEVIDLVDSTAADKIESEYFSGLIGDPMGMKILDLGCGTGKFGLKLSSKAEEVVGIDIAKHQIDIANRTAQKYGIFNFKGIVGNFKSNNYKEYFDVVLAVNMIHHTDDINLILGNVRDSLKKDGRLIIFEVNPLNFLFIPFFIRFGQLKSHLTMAYLKSNIYSLKRVIRINKFKIKQIDKWCFLPTSLYSRSLIFKSINEVLNKIPLIKTFSAFHVIVCSKE